MSVQIHADPVNIAVAAFESDIVRLDIGLFTLMGFSNQKYAAALARTVFET